MSWENVVLTAFAPALPSPLRKTAPYGHPVHRLGDCAGRSPGSRVFALWSGLPSLPVADSDLRLAAHSCGGSHGLPQNQTRFIRLELMRSDEKCPCSLF